MVCDGDLRDREKLRDFMAVVGWIGVDGRGGWERGIVDCGLWTLDTGPGPGPGAGWIARWLRLAR